MVQSFLRLCLFTIAFVSTIFFLIASLLPTRTDSLGRVHMNSCDFCVASYNFDDVEGDFDLEHFDEDVQHDQDCGMIEMMLKADNISRTAWPLEADHGLRLVASPWSPPPWMKAPTPEDAEDAIHAENMTSSAWPSCLREGTGPDSKYAKTKF